MRRDSWRIQRGAARKAMLLTENEIVGERVLEHEPALVAVFGDVRQPAIAALANGCPRHVDAGDVDAPFRRRAESGDRLDQFRLSVSFDARDAEDFSTGYRERDVVHGVRLARAS